MTPLPVPSLPDRLRAHAHLHPETAELLREAADVIDRATKPWPVTASERRDVGITAQDTYATVSGNRPDYDPGV